MVKNCYFDREHRAISDLVDYYGKGLLITRINVPEQHRGKGIASKLLKEICEDADKSNTTLFLEIVPTGGLDYDELARWYSRYGFRSWNGIWRRKPRYLRSQGETVNNQFLYTRETFPGSWAQARLKSRCENWALTAWLLVDEELQKHQEGSPEFILLKRVLDRIDMNLPIDGIPPPAFTQNFGPSFNHEWTQEQINKSKRSVINNALDMLRTLYGDSVCTKEEFGNMLSDTGYAREYLYNSSYQLELWCYFQGTWMNEIPE